MAVRSEPYIIMYPSRRRIFLSNPKPSDIELRDIAHHLALINRFNGATALPYTDAQHCLVAARIAERADGPRMGLIMLLHDAHEPYTVEMITPMKRYLYGYTDLPSDLDELQENFDRAIFTWAGLGELTPQEKRAVRLYDAIALATEWRDLMPDDEPCPTDAAPASFAIKSAPWVLAEQQYLQAFDRLSRASGIYPGRAS